MEEEAVEEKKTGDKIVESTEDILETYRNLVSISLVEYTSLGASASLVGIVYLVFIVFALLFVGLGSAWWLGEVMNNMKAGFFIVSGAFACILIITMLLAKRTLVPFLRNLIIKEIYAQD